MFCVFCVAAIACQGPIEQEGPYRNAVHGLDLTDEVVAGTLAFLNDASTDFERLDIDCGFYADSARNTIEHRNGSDGVYGRGSDNPFDTWDEFVAVPRIGPVHEEAAILCAVDFGFVTVCDGEVEILFESYDELDAELQAVVDELSDRAMSDSDLYYNPGPFSFRRVTIYEECGAINAYEVVVGRLIDPECGVTEWIIYVLDASFNIRSITGDAG